MQSATLFNKRRSQKYQGSVGEGDLDCCLIGELTDGDTLSVTVGEITFVGVGEWSSSPSLHTVTPS